MTSRRVEPLHSPCRHRGPVIMTVSRGQVTTVTGCLIPATRTFLVTTRPGHHSLSTVLYECTTCTGSAISHLSIHLSRFENLEVQSWVSFNEISMKVERRVVSESVRPGMLTCSSQGAAFKSPQCMIEYIYMKAPRTLLWWIILQRTVLLSKGCDHIIISDYVKANDNLFKQCKFHLLTFRCSQSSNSLRNAHLKVRK